MKRSDSIDSRQEVKRARSRSELFTLNRVDEILRTLSKEDGDEDHLDEHVTNSEHETAARQCFEKIDSETMDAFEVRSAVQKLVESLEWSPDDRGAIRELLKTAFTTLVARNARGVRGVLVMIYLYDSVAAVVAKQPEGCVFRDVVEHTVWLCHERNSHALLKLCASKEMRKDEMVIEKLAATRIFRSMIQAKWEEGPYLIFMLECGLYVFLGFAYSLLVLGRRKKVESAPVLNQVLWPLLAFPSLHYFSVKTDITLRFHAKFERGLKELSGHQRKRWCLLAPVSFVFLLLWSIGTWIWHRVAALFALVLYGLPLYIVALIPRFADLRHRVMGILYENLGPWLRTPPQFPTGAHLSVPQGWLREPLNVVEFAFLFVMWMALFGTVAPVSIFRTNTYEVFLNLGVLLMWLRLLHYLRCREDLAAFVILFTSKIFVDIKSFIIVFAIIFFAFCHTLYMAVGFRDRSYWGMEEDDEFEKPFSSLLDTSWILYLFALTGEVSDDTSDRGMDQVYLALILFVMVVVLLNLLIAIVAEAYEDAMARSSDLFWRSRFELVADTIALWGRAAIFYDLDSIDLDAIVRTQLHESFDETLMGGASHRKQLARILQAVQAETPPLVGIRADLALLHSKIDALQAQFAGLHLHPALDLDDPPPPYEEPVRREDTKEQHDE